VGWLVQSSELTPEQQRAVALDTRAHKAIIGGPGSGKTLVLAHRLRRLYENAGGRPEAVKMFVYTATLKEFIRSGVVMDMGLPEGLVTTLDKWCGEVHKKHIGPLPWTTSGKRRMPDFDATRRAVHERLTNGSLKLAPYDAVLIDEAQDLDAEALDILRHAARHITVTVDGKQQLYDTGLSESGVLERLGLKQPNVAILSAFRCNPMVTQVAAQFIQDETARVQFLRQAKNPRGDRSKPLLFTVANMDDEKARIVALARSRADQSIVILLPQKRWVFGFANGLRERGLEVEVGGNQNIDFNSPLPKVMTYHGAKGLTFDTVFLPSLDTAAFTGHLLRRVDQLLFVGASRAARWVCLSGIESRLLPAVERLSENADGFLEVQRRGAGGPFGVKNDEDEVLADEVDARIASLVDRDSKPGSASTADRAIDEQSARRREDPADRRPRGGTAPKRGHAPLDSDEDELPL
jgi:superfamily I DNA/RNA helicase